jgi:hypothetical protein
MQELDAVLQKDLKQVDITAGRNNYYDLDSTVAINYSCDCCWRYRDGRGMPAAMVLGADGVQVGSRFAASVESSAHTNFKDTIIEVKEEVRSNFKRTSSSTSNQK